MILCNKITLIGSETLLVFLHFRQDEVELRVLLPVFVGMQWASLHEVVDEVGLLPGGEGPTSTLTVHPFGLQAIK